MNKKTAFFGLSSCLFGLSGAFGQGLLSVGSDYDFESDIPFTVTLGAAVGFDSNVNSSSQDEQDSVYYQGGVSLGYGSSTRTTQFNIGAGFSAIYYDDPGETVDEDLYDARLTFNIRHEATSRLTISDQAFISYETEPNFNIGASTSRRSDQYFYGYNNLSIAYAWSRRFSTVSNYTFSAIEYEEDELDNENRISHLLSQQFVYSISRVTSLTAEYRFDYTEFDDGVNDFIDHFVLVGVDHSFNRNLSGSVRVGAQFRDYDNRDGSQETPYLEGALNYKAGKATSIRWYNRLGQEASEIGSFEENFAYRTGISATHKFTPELTGNAGVNYSHREFSDSQISPDISEDLVNLNIGLSYEFSPGFNFYTNYYFTNVSSDNEFREFDRHRVAVGVNATF